MGHRPRPAGEAPWARPDEPWSTTRRGLVWQGVDPVAAEIPEVAPRVGDGAFSLPFPALAVRGGNSGSRRERVEPVGSLPSSPRSAAKEVRGCQMALIALF